MIPYRASLRSDLASRGLSEPPDSLPRNRWTICPGPAGRFGSDQLDELDRNEWTLSSGPGGRFHRNTHPSDHQLVNRGRTLISPSWLESVLGQGRSIQNRFLPSWAGRVPIARLEHRCLGHYARSGHRGACLGSHLAMERTCSGATRLLSLLWVCNPSPHRMSCTMCFRTTGVSHGEAASM